VDEERRRRQQKLRAEEEEARLGRLLDECLDGMFPKPLLEERKRAIERALRANEAERANLQTALELRDLKQKQLRRSEKLAAQGAVGLSAMAQDFESRHDEDKALYVSCGLGPPN